MLDFFVLYLFRESGLSGFQVTHSYISNIHTWRVSNTVSVLSTVVFQISEVTQDRALSKFEAVL